MDDGRLFAQRLFGGDINAIKKIKNPGGLFRGYLTRIQAAAQEALEYAYDHKTYQDQTYNLRDSYGYGIYWNKKLVAMGTLEGEAATQEKKVPRGTNIGDTTGFKAGFSQTVSGREMIQQYFNDVNSFRKYTEAADREEELAVGEEDNVRFVNDFTGRVGIKVVFVAAMWYADILEKPASHMMQKYYVLASFNNAITTIFQMRLKREERAYMASPVVVKSLHEWYTGSLYSAINKRNLKKGVPIRLLQDAGLKDE